MDFAFTDYDLPNLGCYNPASAVPGGSPSLHRDGRAADIGHYYDDESIMRVQSLVDVCVERSEAIGCQQIIWRRQFWRTGNTQWLPYYGPDPHTSHAHIEFTRAASAYNTIEHYQSVIGDTIMTDEQIERLGESIARHIMTWNIRVMDYAQGKQIDVPLDRIEAFRNEELSLIRRHLRGEG